MKSKAILKQVWGGAAVNDQLKRRLVREANKSPRGTLKELWRLTAQVGEAVVQCTQCAMFDRNITHHPKNTIPTVKYGGVSMLKVILEALLVAPLTKSPTNSFGEALGLWSSFEDSCLESQ